MLLLFTICGTVLAAKYTINTSGSVKTNGKIVAPAIKNPYSVYNAGQYVNTVASRTSAIAAVDIVMDYSG